VAGIAVDSVTGEPVPRAHVTLNGFTNGKQRSYGAMTTAEGKFSITGLPGGNYYLSAERLGFVPNSRIAGTVSIKPGDHKADLTLKLTPTGAIAGIVLDAEGEPVEHCSVLAESGRGGQPSSTDAQGKFRLGGLAPGKYRIKATPEDLSLPPEIRTDGTSETHYSPTYYPNSLDDAGAARVAVQPGIEAGGNEIRLVRTPIVRVSGKVTGLPPGAENVQFMVQQARNNPGRFGSMGYATNWHGARVKKDGTFSIWRLAPGPYRIGAQWNNSASQMVAAPVDVVVGDTDIDGVELRMVAAANLSGQVEYEDDDAKPPGSAEQSQQARTMPQEFLQGIDGTNGGFASRVDAANAFTIERVVPGRYRVNWNAAGGYIKSMRLGQSEIQGPVLDLSNGAAGVTLTLVIGSRYGSVSGTVQSDGASTAGMVVALLPGDQESGAGMPWQSASVGADGSYTLNRVVPGTYKLAAVAQDDLNALMQGGDEWDQYAPVMETVTITAADKATQDLKILAR